MIGFDGYRMASFGHDVVMFEQHPLLALMTQHALREAQHTYRIVCHQGRAEHWQQYTTTIPDVVYLDPNSFQNVTTVLPSITAHNGYNA